MTDSTGPSLGGNSWSSCTLNTGPREGGSKQEQGLLLLQANAWLTKLLGALSGHWR